MAWEGKGRGKKRGGGVGNGGWRRGDVLTARGRRRLTWFVNGWSGVGCVVCARKGLGVLEVVCGRVDVR